MRNAPSKLTDADAEQHETQHGIDEAVDCEYLNAGKAVELISELKEIGRMLNSMIDKAHLFWGDNTYVVHESLAKYFVSDSDTPTSD